MSTAFEETDSKKTLLGIDIDFATTPGGHHPMHWHEKMEILYPLNGDASIRLEGKRYSLPTKKLTVIESRKVHSTHSKNKTNMYLCIHVSQKQLVGLLPNIELYEIQCIPEEIPDALFPQYLEICNLLANLTRLYIAGDGSAFTLEANGIVLQVLARLYRYFSVSITPKTIPEGAARPERIYEVITYVEEHFRDPVTLQDICDYVGLGKEYFCRYFKKHMGMSFLHYLSEIRMAHAYQDLLSTDLPVSQIMEENGFANQKLFNSSFKQLYGCTPSAVRKQTASPDETKS